MYTFFAPSQGGYTRNLTLIDRAVLDKKVFENNGHKHVFSPTAGAENPLGYFFHEHNYSVNLVFCCKFSPIR